MNLSRTASFGCPRAIAIELQEVLPVDWKLSQEGDSFVVRGAMKEGWLSEIWRVTRFVAYPTFVSLEEVERSTHHVEQLVLSLDSRGGGYRIRFRLGMSVVRAGESAQAEVIDVRDNGVYLRADGRDGFINITELTWMPGAVRPADFAKVGDTIAVHVYAVTESGFYASLKALNPTGDPFRDLSIYSEGALHRGQVWAIRTYGVHVLLESGAIGLLPSQTQTHAPRIGDPVEVEVVSFDVATRKLALRLLQSFAEADSL